MIRKALLLSVGLFFVFALLAQEVVDSAYMALYHRYYRLFDTDSTEEFYNASEQLQQRYMKRGEMLSYYKIRQNEIFYDAAHGESYQAIKKANDLLEDMKNSETKYYELPYMSLGSIFEMRGNHGIAVHYYQEALNNTNLKDSTGLAHIYAQLASINLTRNSNKAWEWNERLGHVISHDSLYYKLYLTIKGEIHFFNGEKTNFLNNKREFSEFLKRRPSLDHNGEHVLQVMEEAFDGKYDKAMRLLNEESQDYDDIRRCDIRIRIYEMMGRIDLALKEADKRRDLRDSLSNDLLFYNLNEINATIGVAKLNEKASIERERWLIAVILLLLVAFGLSVSRYITHRRYQKKIEKQNKQLEIAIEEAKEYDRMKDNFIKNISNEMRSPLNVITGYAQLITNPNFELPKEERNKILQAIGQNTAAITDIVNGLLKFSMEEGEPVE